MTREELEELAEVVWFGPMFRLEVVDADTIKVWVDVRPFWPGGPRELVGTVSLREEWEAGAVVFALMKAAAESLVHELQEQVTIHGRRSTDPHKKLLLQVVAAQQPTPVPEGDHDD